MSAIAYIPKSIQGKCDKSKITTIRACASAPQPLSNTSADESTAVGPLTNHWVLHCILAASETSHEFRSIRLDPSPGGLDLSLTLIINLVKTYIETREAATSFELSLTEDATFVQLMDVITTRYLQKYRFTRDGNGCRHWIACAIKAFREHGYLADLRQADVGVEMLGKAWTEEGVPVRDEQQSVEHAGKFIELGKYVERVSP